MKRATATLVSTLLGWISLAALPVASFAQQPQAMCRETLEAWVRDKSLDARWNSDRTAVIMVRGGVEYVCTCPDQNRPPVCKPASSAPAGAARVKATPPVPPPAYPSARPARASEPAGFEREKRELIREIEASGLFETSRRAECGRPAGGSTTSRSATSCSAGGQALRRRGPELPALPRARAGRR